MSSSHRVLSSLTRYSFSPGIITHYTTTSLRSLNSVRPLSLISQRLARSKESADDEVVNSEPIKFSTSKASHRTWKVDRSMGSQYQRPWWKVLPISLFGVGFLLWCTFRGETDIDVQLEKELFEHLPGLLSDEEEEQSETESR
ncbi:ubiquinol-cytochrome c reductase complex assembly factor 4 [Polymixia lowei]